MWMQSQRRCGALLSRFKSRNSVPPAPSRRRAKLKSGIGGKAALSRNAGV
jgi:hypothetical protein